MAREPFDRADLAVFDRHSDMVAILDGDAVVVYANDRLGAVLRMAPEEIVGRSMVDFVHPDDLASAAGSVAGLIEGEIGVDFTPLFFNILCGDDTYIPIEFNGSRLLHEGPFAGMMVFFGRYPGDQILDHRVSELLTSGAPVERVIELVPEYGLWRHPHLHYAVNFTAAHGDEWTGSNSAVLLGRDHPEPDTPWARAIATNEKVESEAVDLPDGLRRSAEALGLSGCSALPVDDPLHPGTGVAVAWTTAGPLVDVNRYVLDQMGRVLALAFQWRLHITELERAARYDALTGLHNRAAFFEQLSSHSASQPEGLVAVLYVDLDKFKAVNDSHGHLAGDIVLVEAARRMREAVRSRDLLARLGGDEFAALCLSVEREEDAVAVAERILSRLSEPIALGESQVVIGASVGIALTSTSEFSPDSLLEKADRAMYAAKSSGCNRWRIVT